MIDQKMPDDLANRQGGWYFVRIYDKDDNLLESIDFRFSAGLKSIQIMNPGCLPEKGRYCNVEVKFNHQVNCKIEPADENLHRTLSICREEDVTKVIIPPNPDHDKSYWIIREGCAKTKVTILIERVWWNVGDLNGVPANWTDRIIHLSRQDFTATSEKALWLKFPRKRWVTKIEVGFNRDRSRPYNVEVEKEVMAVPLRDFCDAEEIENKQVESVIKIWVSPEGTKTYETIVIKIPTELSPTEEPKPPRVKSLLPLRPVVIAPYEWKRDNEISGAEFTVPEQVHIEGYNAHFFDLNQNKSIAFIDGNDERIQLQ
jgi:hypothetical protein